MSLKITVGAFLGTAVIVGCSKQPAASPPSPPPQVMPSKYSIQTSQGDRTLDIWVDMHGLVERDMLQVVESFALTNNLLSRGVGASKIGGLQTHFFALDESAIDGAFVKIGFQDATNAVIEAVYKGTNFVYFDALRASLRATIENHFTGRVIKTESR